MAMATHAFPMLVISLAFLLIHRGFVSVNGDEHFVRDTCSRTDVAKYCSSILLANSSSLTADLLGLATISDWVLISNLTKGRLESVAVQQTATGKYKLAATDCIGSYDSGLKWGMESISFIASKHFVHAKQAVAWAADGAYECQDSYDEFNLTYPEVLSRRQSMISNLHALTNKLIDLNGK